LNTLLLPAVAVAVVERLVNSMVVAVVLVVS
jgi:hypothetical protein